MGLISSFEKNTRTTNTRTLQPGRWNIIRREEGACLCLMAYRSADKNCQDTPPQMMVFKPHHIEEFKELLNEWGKYKREWRQKD